MNWKKIDWVGWSLVVLLIILMAAVLTFTLSVSGCSGTGFEKRATLVPDSISVGLNHSDNVDNPAGWPSGWTGFSVNATWNLK
jgi:hypothetical protein